MATSFWLRFRNNIRLLHWWIIIFVFCIRSICRIVQIILSKYRAFRFEIHTLNCYLLCAKHIIYRVHALCQHCLSDLWIREIR